VTGADGGRFDRLRATATFEGAAHERWARATIAVVGAGVLGSLFAREAARSGAHTDLYDPDIGEEGNRGNQPVEVGEPKAEVVARLCNAIAPGSARAHVADVRHVGAGSFENVSLIVDCTDDAGLALPLTELSNGWGVPLIRLAVDGSGGRELGRVLVSHGGKGRACQLCASSWEEVFDPGSRTPCLGDAREGAPTNAGTALAMSVAGLGLLHAQRLVGGNGANRVLDTEAVVDLDTPGILSMQLRRNEACLSGHKRFHPARLDRAAADTTVEGLFGLARMALEDGLQKGAEPLTDSKGTGPLQAVTLSFRGHPILLGATCTDCGLDVVRPGTLQRRAAACPRCGGPMVARRDAALDRLNLAQARALGLADMSCEALGLPSTGALVDARAPGHSTVQLLFA
jgi:molybdopterin/thiamine biosynthesis adenylyltransferase